MSNIDFISLETTDENGLWSYILWTVLRKKQWDLTCTVSKAKSITRRERLKSALCLRLKKRKVFKIVHVQKGGTLSTLKIQFVANTKKIEGEPLETKKSKKSHSAEKIQTGDPVVPSSFVSFVKNWVHKRGDPLH